MPKESAEALLLAQQPTQRTRRVGTFAVAYMGGEDKEAFDERDTEDTYDHNGDLAEYFAHKARDKEHGHEGDHVGQDAEGDGHGNFPSPAHRGIKPGQSFLVIMINVFPHHDGIIHHDTQGDDEREHGHHVDAYAHGGQENK